MDGAVSGSSPVEGFGMNVVESTNRVVTGNVFNSPLNSYFLLALSTECDYQSCFASGNVTCSNLGPEIGCPNIYIFYSQFSSVCVVYPDREKYATTDYFSFLSNSSIIKML
jgi:hypothetical protein